MRARGDSLCFEEILKNVKRKCLLTDICLGVLAGRYPDRKGCTPCSVKVQHEFQPILQLVVIRGVWIVQCSPFFHLWNMSRNSIRHNKTTRVLHG